jgi:hypothetical protein
LEPYDFSFANDSIGGASGLGLGAGSPGHLVASVAGSLYTGEGTDYYALGRLDPGNAVNVASRTISLSTLNYRIQMVGKIVGIGLNVNQEKFPGELSNTATSLRVETGKAQSRMELLVRLLREIETDYNRFLREGPGFVTERFLSLSNFAKGKRVRVDTGSEAYIGTTTGLTVEGLLQVKKEDGPVVTVIAGDVTEVR